MLNICLCGRCWNYSHTVDCPYPYYGNNDKDIIKWIEEQKELIIENDLNRT